MSLKSAVHSAVSGGVVWCMALASLFSASGQKRILEAATIYYATILFSLCRSSTQELRFAVTTGWWVTTTLTMLKNVMSLPFRYTSRGFRQLLFVLMIILTSPAFMVPADSYKFHQCAISQHTRIATVRDNFYLLFDTLLAHLTSSKISLTCELLHKKISICSILSN